MQTRRSQRRRKQQQQPQPPQQDLQQQPQPEQQEELKDLYVLEQQQQDAEESDGQLGRQPCHPGQVRAQTPLQRRELTSCQDASADDMPGSSSPKMAMFCPQPRRIFAPQPSAPCAGNPPGSPWSAQDEACNELRELLGTRKETDLMFDANHAEARPLSSVSTNAGPTPGPDDRAFTPANDRAETPQSPILEEYDDMWSCGGGDGASAMQPRDTEGGKEKAGITAQVRKVFVGGIPQDMNQDDLYAIFSNFAGVKKAWLQRHRTAGATYSSPPRNHRGFGFVIFHDGSTVEKLLGNSTSRFIMLADGRKLEVKRAVSSNDMMTVPSANGSTPQPAPRSPPSPPPDPQWQGVQAPKPSGSPWPGDSAWPGPMPAMPPPLPPLPSMPSMPAQPATLAAATPWPPVNSGSVPAVMQAPQAYSSVAGIYVPGTAAAHHPSILLQARADVPQMLPGGGGAVMPREGQAELVMPGRTQIMLAPGPVCEQVNGTMIQRQSWVVDPSAQATMQLAMGQARVPTGPVPPLLSPQPMMASWAPNTAGGAVAVPSHRTQGPTCPVQWVQGNPDMRTAACSVSPALPDADVHAPIAERATSSGNTAPVVLPNGLMAPESQQQPSYQNIKELESALLQAMPEYYDD
mmetsp:Transcript_110564/g.323503  ORF Transcript_110564/g.323503 Transcript_110564/m.323503 type:complete len:633 (-) Transcript_110564:156-2054(-)